MKGRHHPAPAVGGHDAAAAQLVGAEGEHREQAFVGPLPGLPRLPQWWCWLIYCGMPIVPRRYLKILPKARALLVMVA